MSRPLEGVKVLDFSRLLPGPFCSLLLADMGAEVVKIEEPGQGDATRWMPPLIDGSSAWFIALNRGKKSLTLDLRSPAGREAARRLAGTFDVVLETFRPGVMDRLGLGYEALSALNPRLVYCSISGYGQHGPYRHRAGHDLDYLALSGVLGAMGPRSGPPETPPVQIADVAGGSYPAAVSILGALFARERTGRGHYLDISMTDGALAMMMPHLTGHMADGNGCLAGRMPLSGGMNNYRTYQTRDGKAIALGALEPKFWLKFLEVAGRPELGPLMHRDTAEGEAARGELEQLFRSRTRDEWAAALEEADACLEPVLEADEVVYHPLHLGRGMIREIDAPDGEGTRVVMTPLPFGREAVLEGKGGMEEKLRPAPALGVDGVAVLKAHGFSDDEIERLKAEGGL